MTLAIDWGNLDHMLAAMDKVGGQAAEIDTYFDTYVCDTSFGDYDSCCLKPLSDQLPKVGGWFHQARTMFDTRWSSVSHAVALTAREIDMLDGHVGHDLSKYLDFATAAVSAADTTPSAGLGSWSLKIAEVSDDLAAPEDGDQQLKGHDPTYTKIKEGYDGLRDTINSAIDKINGVSPEPLSKLPEKSLDDYIVYPLSGNYRRLQANGDACTTADTVMGDWGTNFTKLSGQVAVTLQGETSAALMAELNVYNLAMTGVGKVVGAGEKVFDNIAKVSEKIAIQVEKALVVLGKKLTKLVAKLSSRVLSYFGWFLLAKDLVEKGLKAITDIVDDVKKVISIIDACFELVDEIKAWAQRQADRLKTFDEVVDIVKKIPTASTTDTLTDLSKVDLGPIKEDLSNLDIDFGADGGKAKDDLDKALDKLGGDTADKAPAADTQSAQDPTYKGPNGENLVELGPDGRPIPQSEWNKPGMTV